jgi:hypothetical protein
MSKCMLTWGVGLMVAAIAGSRRLMLCTLLGLCWVGTSAYGMTITDPSQLSPNPTIIDFEDVNTGGNLLTSLPNPATLGGVTFTSLTGTLSVFDISLAGWPADGTEVASKTLFPGGEPDSAISITFVHPVAEFLLGWGDPNFPGNVLRAYDANGNVLEEAAVALGPIGGVHAAWIGFKRSTADITKIIVQPDQSPPSGDDYVIDNIHYHTAIPDEDNDRVSDAEDVCPGTVIPERVPTEQLGVNRYALIDNDAIFDTRPPQGKKPGQVFTLTDTAGCSCEQIIKALRLDEGQTKYGCSSGTMTKWIEMVQP